MTSMHSPPLGDRHPSTFARKRKGARLPLLHEHGRVCVLVALIEALPHAAAPFRVGPRPGCRGLEQDVRNVLTQSTEPGLARARCSDPNTPCVNSATMQHAACGSSPGAAWAWRTRRFPSSAVARCWLEHATRGLRASCQPPTISNCSQWTAAGRSMRDQSNAPAQACTPPVSSAATSRTMGGSRSPRGRHD